MKLARAIAASAGLALVAWFPACQSPTEITFVITTDQPCASLGGTAISVGVLGTELDRKPATTVSKTCDDATHSLGKLVVTPSGASNAEVAARIVVGVGKSAEQCIVDGFVGGCIVARRALRFIPHTPLTVAVALEKACLDNPCAPTQTCSRGACIDAHAQDCQGSACDGGTPQGAWVALPNQSFVMGKYRHFGFLQNGEAWFSGGLDPIAPFATDTVRYAPATKMWSYSGPSNTFTTQSHRPISPTEKGFITWGGDPATREGARFDGTTWTPMVDPATQSGLATFKGRMGHAHVWIPERKELVVWGGFDAAAKVLDDGAIYTPATDTWKPMKQGPLVARTDIGAVAVGGKVVLYGGECGGPCNDGAVYDPASDTWSTLITSLPRKPDVALGDGKRAIFFDTDDAMTTTDVAIFEVSPPSIQIVGSRGTHPQAPSPRRNSAGWLANGKLFIWGGAEGVAETRLADGASYDFATDTWRAMPAGPSARRNHAIVWTGSEAVLFGGEGPSIDGGNAPVLGDAWSFR